MDNNGKRAEFGVFLAENGIGLGWGNHFEDRRWENEVKLYLRQNLFEGGLLSGLKALVIPSAWSAWKRKEIAHETFYGWGFLGLYVDIPRVKSTCRFLSQ